MLFSIVTFKSIYSVLLWTKINLYGSKYPDEYFCLSQILLNILIGLFLYIQMDTVNHIVAVCLTFGLLWLDKGVHWISVFSIIHQIRYWKGNLLYFLLYLICTFQNSHYYMFLSNQNLITLMIFLCWLLCKLKEFWLAFDGIHI